MSPAIDLVSPGIDKRAKGTSSSLTLTSLGISLVKVYEGDYLVLELYIWVVEQTDKVF